MSWLPDAAGWLVARGELRRRWRSFVVLGVLIGAVAGLATAGAAGARRATGTLDRYLAVSPQWDAAVVPNDPTFSEEERRTIANLPEVASAQAFAVTSLGLLVDGELAPELAPYLAPVAEDYGPKTFHASFVVKRGRAYDVHAADELIIAQEVARDYGLDVGDTAVVASSPDEFSLSGDADSMTLRYPVRVVGVVDVPDNERFTELSPAFMAAHGDDFFHITNEAVFLRPGVEAADLQRAAAAAIGRPTLPVLDVLKEKRDAHRTADLEANGLALFALAALVGGGTLVGQALVRAISAGAADAAVMSALGMGARRRRLTVATPAVLCAAISGVLTVGLAIALSPLFPIGLSRTYDIDPGVHADWLVLSAGAVGVVGGVLAVALVAAWWATMPHRPRLRRPRLAGAVLRAGLPVPTMVGTRLALDPGRGQRAVPIRSAAIGAVVGVLGVVGSFTFRAGLEDTLAHPERAGVQGDAIVFGDELADTPPEAFQTVRDDPAVGAATFATWWRALPIGPTGTAVWAYRDLVGKVGVTVLRGRTPITDDEIALAPRSLTELGVDVGGRVGAPGARGGELVVVGEVLLPNESHQGYDSGGFMTWDGAEALAPPERGAAGVDRQEAFLVDWKPGADVGAASDRLGQAGLTVQDREPPSTYSSLSNLLTLPFWLGCFLALLAVATVAHALTTTVRRRRQELAVLAALGLSTRQARLSITVQATLLAIVGLLGGVPLGIAAGRVLWRTINDALSFLYVAPLALVAVLVVWPVAVAVANLLVAAPARQAGRIRPAVVLRTE
jgi:ABC-type lipoprotein release transport system permease subunit